VDGVGATQLVEQAIEVGGVRLALLRPRDPEALLDEEAFGRDEFLPYWAELWPAALALARALPARLDGVRVVELGCGLGIPSLVAAARGARVTATDWAPEAIDLLRENAARNGLDLRAEARDWRDPPPAGGFDLALAADVLYEHRNVGRVLAALARLAPEALLAEPGRPYWSAFLRAAEERWRVETVGDRVYRLVPRAPVE
jgi:predicted nicotinamide N-methyase